MRFVCRMRSRSSVARSRETRRRSSSLGVGGTVMAQTPRLASLPGHQRAQQRLAVDRIGLGAPVASRHSNRRRIDDVALNAVGLEQAVNPETIEPGFLDRYNLDQRSDALLGSALQPRKKVEQFARVTADERVLGHLPAAERQ